MPMPRVRMLVPILALAFAPAVFADEPPKPADGSGPAAAPAVESVGVAFEPGTPALADVLAKAATEKKPAFLDFFTDT